MNASWSLIQYPALFKRNDPRDGYDSHIDSGQIDYSFVIIQSSQSLYLKNQLSHQVTSPYASPVPRYVQKRFLKFKNMQIR